MKVDVAVLIGVLGALSTIVFSYLAYSKGQKKECKDEGVLMSDVGYIKAGIDDLKRKQEKSEARHFELAERVAKVEASAASAHLRIDEHVRSDEK